MKRLLFFVILIPLFVSACSGAAATEETTTSFTVTDSLGREVTFDAVPQRIVITGKASFMISDVAYAFPEAAERIIGLDTTSGQTASGFTALLDPEFESKAVLESGAAAEQVVALNPDLVIMKSYLADSVGATYEAVDIPVVYVDFETPEQYPRDLAIFGKIFQNEARATELTEYFQGRLENIQNTAGAAREKPRALVIYYSDKDGNIAFNVPPMGWIQTQMVKAAGGEPVWPDANLGNGWTTVTLEQIAAWDADQIFVIYYSGNSSDIVAGFQKDPQWQALRAAQEGQLWAFPGDFYSWDQADTRWTLGLYWLAAHLQPELYADYNAMQDAQSFYQTVYGIDEATFSSKVQPLLKVDLTR